MLARLGGTILANRTGKQTVNLKGIRRKFRQSCKPSAGNPPAAAPTPYRQPSLTHLLAAVRRWHIAQELGKWGIGTDLNPEYLDLARDG